MYFFGYLCSVVVGFCWEGDFIYDEKFVVYEFSKGENGSFIEQ